jgi:lysozyme family protein
MLETLMSVTTAAPDRFTSWLYDFCWRPDFDGQPYHVTPGDLGGPTAWGVTCTEFIAWQVKHRIYGSGQAQLQAASKPYLAQIIRADYWNAVLAGEVWAGLDWMLVDRAFCSGQGNAVELLQKTLGFTGEDVDGDIGPDTKAAANAVDDRADFIKRYNQANLDWLKTRATYNRFGGGWDRRQNDCKALALALYNAPNADAPGATS